MNLSKKTFSFKVEPKPIPNFFLDIDKVLQSFKNIRLSPPSIDRSIEINLFHGFNKNWKLNNTQIQALWFLDFVYKHLENIEIKQLLIDFLENPENKKNELMLKISPDKEQDILNEGYFDQIYPKLATDFNLNNFNEFLSKLTKTIKQLCDVNDLGDPMIRSILRDTIRNDANHFLSRDLQKFYELTIPPKSSPVKLPSPVRTPSPTVIFSSVPTQESKVEEAQQANIKNILGY